MFFGKKENISTLEEVLESSWKLLHYGVRDFREPFHQFTLTTMESDKPQARIVIIRAFSEKDRSLICHCDVRGSKISQIRDNPNVGLLFYDAERWLQLRFSGTASVHTNDEMADCQWEQVRLSHRINYCAEIPPGSHIEKPTSGIPDFIRDKVLKSLDVPAARKNFATIVCRFDEMDWLLLKLTGHIRAKFQWGNDSTVKASWVIP
ncbi:Pyridoxamine 5'-phosphate oxidase [Syntrophus gentianae]|uniref:Pyridoxamine 5'-phosphate oxidase n=1 Tax=Syntrophus gentianae TaxID=43775 RepID=A0A1H8AXR1_9BACT|nr:pyridoxamine 5'-phosphate oxidase family protein [Syntrophus gentianae]SEM74277.1 Pyridoxamine 5'-phosphate oxidase [Syntrophus gentianae]